MPMPKPAPSTFIETQLPVSKLSKECYKERKANYSQTLTGLGKWWGRKPLILVRACILGLLMPASRDAKRDREVFLKILTMDPEGLLRRRSKFFTQKQLREELCSGGEFNRWAKLEEAIREAPSKARKDQLRAELNHFKDQLQRKYFLLLSYDDKLAQCDRPEQIEGPSAEAWAEINAHFARHFAAGEAPAAWENVASLPALIQQLGHKRFGHTPRVGDAFCGGGSIPFEAARIGCEAYGSDLNPVAALLTWAALNIVGGGPEVARRVREAQERVYAAVDQQVTDWGIEHGEIDRERLAVVLAGEGRKTSATAGDFEPTVRADAYLYCVEVECPETGWRVPLAPSWVIGEKTRTVAQLVPDPERQRYDLRIKMDASDAEMAAAKEGTVQGKKIIHPALEWEDKQPGTLEQARLQGHGRTPGARYHDNGLRLWENDDVVPRPGDVFQERLYCIRWVASAWVEYRGEIQEVKRRYYAAPTEADQQREARVLELLRERFHDWQAQGYLPSRSIEPGAKTDEPIRTRGWTHWHHLFNPRQLLVLGEFLKVADKKHEFEDEKVITLLGVHRIADYNSRISPWSPTLGKELVNQVFANQALNTLLNYGTQGVCSLPSAFRVRFPDLNQSEPSFSVNPLDARRLTKACSFWITDPPYADAINYHELSEFFLGWSGGLIDRIFDSWTGDTKRALAVKGSSESFRRSMVDCYSNLAKHMPEDGQQVVMFTHQDAGVWADLALILWAAGLRVTAAWCIATETDSALKAGNYVQGTVLLILRRQTGDATAFLDDIYPEVEDEVRRQLDAMHDMDSRSPGFQPGPPKGPPEAAAALHFNPDEPVTISQRNLPHWEQEGATYFITFRQADALPADKRRQIQAERASWMQLNPPPWSSETLAEYHERFSERLEGLLDAGYGSCVLRDPAASKIVADALQHFAGERYELGAWVVMSNHVHVIVRPLPGHPLATITHSWKSFTANQLNRLTGSTGPFWQEESYDRIIRNADEYRRIERYILENPQKAGISVHHIASSSGFQPDQPESKNRLEACATAVAVDVDVVDEPNFGDTDYQLAAYAAALRVLTGYRRIEDIDVAYELAKPRQRGEKSPVEAIIEEAVKTACDHLVPRGFDGFIWKTLGPEERFYLKGLELQSHAEFRSGAYMELARGFGIRDYSHLLGKTKANQTRLRTATDFGRKHLGDPGFGSSLTRQALFAIREVVAADHDATRGRQWLKDEVPDYWTHRKTLLELLRYLARLEHVIPDWKPDAEAARLLAGAVENDHR